MSRQRSLAVVLFADIVGYTAMMQRDEAQARRSVQKFREELDLQITSNGGRIINYFGDGCLATFPSAVGATRCALEAQRAFRTQPEVPVRIGLHSGEVFHADDTVYGDSVNLASRIESIGIPGTVLLSDRVARDIKNQPDLTTRSLGSFQFKNVEGETEVYALSEEGIHVPSREELVSNGKVISGARKRWPWLLAVLAVLFGSLGALYFSGALHSERAMSNDRFSMAILPFNVQGSPDIQYLSEGMSDLLSTRIDGMGDIGVVDPNAVLGLLSERGTVIRNPETAVELVERFGANHFVIGSITQLSDQFQFVASLYNTRGELVIKVSQMAEGEAELPAVIDQLALRLLTGELDIEGTESMKTAAMTTDNLPALKAFLEGEQHRRRSSFNKAINKYEAALAADSTFALAWYRLDYTLGWVPKTGYDGSYFQKAVEYKEELPEKFQRLIQIKALRIRYLTKEAIAEARDLANQYPHDTEVLITLGDLIYHYNGLEGKPAIEALPYFERVMALDPGHLETLLHLGNLYDQTGDTARIADIAEQFASDSYGKVYLDALLAIHAKDSLEREKIISRLIQNPNFAPDGILANSTNNYNLEEVVAFMEELNRQYLSQPHPFLEVMLPFTSGRYDAAMENLSRMPAPMGEGMKAAMTIILRSLPINSGFEALSREEVEEFRMALTRYPTVFERSPFMSRIDFFDAQCVLSLAAGQVDTFQYYRNAIETLGTDPDYRDLVRYTDHKYKALQAYYRGEYEAAERNIDSTFASYSLPRAEMQSRILLRLLPRILKAELLYSSGRLEEALPWYETIIGEPPSLILGGLAYLRRAQIYERLDRMEEAIRLYEKFVRLYENADPPLQKFVELARERKQILFSKTL